MNLNIIGNGFDLYHGLPSSYYYFGCYLIENNPDLYMEMSKWFGFRYYSIARGYPYEDFEYGVEEQFWSSFEEALGIVDETAIVDTYNYDLGLEIEDYDIPMDDDLLADRIREAFVLWVSETLDVDDNYEIIREYKGDVVNRKFYKMKFSGQDKFLVFNYTHILQKVYGIYDHNIWYIHGECTGNDDDRLLFGHGNKKRMEEIKNIIAQYDSRSLYQSERTNQLEYECLLRFMRNLEKDVEECKEEADFFYKQFGEEPKFVNVYGMSLGEVDFSYFEQIRKQWPNAMWRFSYYSERDKERINLVVKRLGIPENQYSIFYFNNPRHKEIENRIVQKRKIVTYEQVENK